MGGARAAGRFAEGGGDDGAARAADSRADSRRCSESSTDIVTAVPELSRILSNVDHVGCYAGTRCWLWRSYLNPAGYPMTSSRIDGEMVSVALHRWIWEQMRGPIPEGHQIQHKCGMRRCLNPRHLEPIHRNADAEVRLLEARLFDLGEFGVSAGLYEVNPWADVRTLGWRDFQDRRRLAEASRARGLSS